MRRSRSTGAATGCSSGWEPRRWWSRAPRPPASAGSSRSARCWSAMTANSAFHGTRLDVEHIGRVMEEVVRRPRPAAESRHELAGETVFVSHETYTPARGGSAAAEIHALREVFGAAADRIADREHQGTHRAPDGGRDRGRRGDQVAGDRDRPPRAQLRARWTPSSGCSTSPRAAPTRSATRSASPPASAPRSA